MSDITFMKGYGFPRGSAMDYAGYAGNPDPSAGDLNYGPVRFEGVTQSRMRIRSMPDPSNFAPIPALDGIFCEDGYGPVRFGRARRYGDGVDVTMGPLTVDATPGYFGPAGIGADGLVHYANGATCDPNAQTCPGGPFTNPNNAMGAVLGWGLLVVGVALFMNR